MEFDKEEEILWNAVNANDIDLVRASLDSDRNAGVVRDRRLFIKKAILKNNYDLVDLLSSHTLSIDSYCKTLDDDYTFLHIAVIFGNKEIVKLFLSRGADVSLVSSEFKRTALHVAVLHNKLSLIELLLESGCDITAIDNKGNTVLHLFRNDSLRVLKISIASGCDANRVNNDGDTCLMLYLRGGHFNISEYLLKENICTSIKRDLRGDTLLHMAVSCNSSDIMRMVLKLGVDINAVDNNGFTALHLAVMKNKVPLIQLLLESGCDINAVDKEGNTVLHLVRNNSLQILLILLASGCDANRVNKNGETCLMLYLRGEHLHFSENLLRKNIGTRIKRDLNGDTLLHMVVRYNRSDIIRMVLNLGVDINAVDNSGCTAFDIACQYRKYSSIETLLKYNCDVTNVEITRFSVFRNQNLITLKMQAIKLSALNRAEGVRNLQHIENVPTPEFDTENYWNACNSEIKKMETIKIGDTNVTLLNVLQKDINQIAKLFKNDAISQFSLNQEDLATFPIYNHMIDYLFTVGRIRCTLIHKCTELCISNSSLRVLSVECIEIIFNNLVNDDLFVLLHSLEL